MRAGGRPGSDRAHVGDLRRTMRLFRRYRGGRRVYVVGILLLLLEAATAVIEPLPIAYLIDFLQGAQPALRDLGFPAFLDSERTETILLLTLGIVAIAAVNSAADSFTEVCMARGGRSLGYRIRVAMYSHLQRLPLAYHDKKRTGDVLTRVTGDVLVVEEFIVTSVSNILGSLMVLVGSFTFLLFKSWLIALVAVIVVPILAVVSNHFSRRIKTASKTQRTREGELASTAQEMLSSIRLVQSYGRGTVDLARFSDQTERSMQASVSAANIQAQFSFVIALVEALSISAVVWLGVWLVDRDAITIGTLVLFVLLLQNMFKPSRKIVSEWYKIGKVFASVERIDDLLDREVVVQDAPDAVDAPPLEGRLTFAHVSFAYPAEHEDGSRATPRPGVLDDIDFEAHPGEVVALVGFSGAGKSTIAQLVPRLYDPDDGEVLIDGRPLRSLTLSSLRRQVSVVLQDTVLLSGTVAENIGYGVANATQEDIEQAARLANAHEFIMALPEGYQTELGERGSTLSGGQRQRLAIARAFIRHAPILILDEPTTGLDPESANAVVGALRTLMRGKTTLLISHDLSLIRNADRALVIARGHIVESGPPARLLESGGLYAELQAGELGAGAASGSRPSRVGHSGGSALTRRLGRRLAGLDAALDGAAMADRIEDRLLERDVSVADVRVGKVWVRGDGSCTLRYHMELSGESSPESALIVGRLHETDDGATTYVNRELAQLPGLRTSTLLKPPWHGVAALVASSGLVLHPFPLDPELPTLPRALEPKLWRRVPELATMLPQSAVEIVHYPREGACVLRFHVATSHNGQAESGGRALYGKVYAADQGRLVHDFLTQLGDASAPTGPRFPRPVVYVPREQLLITEPLPGLPMIRDVLKATWEDEQPNGVASRRDTLAAAARAAGEALAGLHATRLSRVPVRNATDELAALRSELAIVARDWPETAEAVGAAIDGLTPIDLAPAEMVLSHGDFTPSQILLVAGQPAVVDLDTLCWADPALDLGRFIAQLQLLGAKHGSDAVQVSVDELCDEFVAGYDAVADLRGRTDAAPTDRIAFYRATTLARSALRSCRQLKDHRLEVARSLLEATTSQLSRRLVR